MDGWMDGWVHGWMDGWMNGWMDGRMDGRMDGWGPTEGACSMVVPAMSTKPRTSALRMPSTHPPPGTPIIGGNTLCSCP